MQGGPPPAPPAPPGGGRPIGQEIIKICRGKKKKKNGIFKLSEQVLRIFDQCVLFFVRMTPALRRDDG